LAPSRSNLKKQVYILGNRFGFAGVYTQKRAINLEVHLNHSIISPRINRVVQASANRFHHTLKLTRPEDVDDELMQWLREAYELKK